MAVKVGIRSRAAMAMPGDQGDLHIEMIEGQYWAICIGA